MQVNGKVETTISEAMVKLVEQTNLVPRKFSTNMWSTFEKLIASNTNLLDNVTGKGSIHYSNKIIASLRNKPSKNVKDLHGKIITMKQNDVQDLNYWKSRTCSW